MSLILFLMAVIWFGGAWLSTPRGVRLSGIGILLGAVLLGHVILPDRHPVRELTGGSAAPWLVLGLLALIIWSYTVFLARIRRKAGGEQTQTTSVTSELERNARHIVLREIGGPGQKRLKNAKVLVIGAGGLGSPVLSYLAAAGIGTIGVIDDDVVDNSNLQRQVIHDDADIGRPKVQSALDSMTAQNPHVNVRPYKRRLTEDIAADLFAEYDLILDGTDNFETRYLANRAAVKTGRPLISGALSQWEGQVSLFHPADDAPCYQCVFPKAPEAGLAPSCAEAGVVGPLPGVVGSMMAVEAIKELAGAGEGLRGRMLIYDALFAEVRTIKISRRENCETCGGIRI